jgi:hypothetical protein
MLSGKPAYEAELTLMNFAVSEDDSDQPAEPYIAKVVFEGNLPDGSQILLEYQTGTTQPGVRTSGKFSGNETVTKENGSQVTGCHQGVWRRETQGFKLFSLVAHNDNTQSLRMVEVKLDQNADVHLSKVQMETYSV